MIYLHKILPIFSLPIMLIIIVILIGLIKNKIIYIAIGVLYILSTPIFSNNFFKLFEGSKYRKPIITIDSADAIVVLNRMLEINDVEDSTYVEWGDPDRFFGGIALFKVVKAQNVVFTRGKMPWDKAKKTEGEVLKEYAILNCISSEKIFVMKDLDHTNFDWIPTPYIISSNKKLI